LASVHDLGHSRLAEHEANARLIAAAPDMLAALEELTEEAYANMTGGKGHLIDNARAAIAKATTQQSNGSNRCR